MIPINRRPQQNDHRHNIIKKIMALLVWIIGIICVIFGIIWMLWDFPQSVMVLFFGAIAVGLTRR